MEPLKRRVRVDGQPATIIDEYDDGTPEAGHFGYYYRIDGDTRVHWISLGGAVHRMTQLNETDL
jgi:hypothetical protein